MCVCVPTPVSKELRHISAAPQGGSARLTDTAQRRHCQLVVKQCGTPPRLPAPILIYRKGLG